MLIKFLEKRYEVIQKLKTTGVLDLYVAKDINDVRQKLYTIVCVSDRELARKLIPFTTKENTSIAFKDLHESFNLEGKYYIVFQYAQGETLQQVLQENVYDLKERLLLLKNIFGQIILLNMPECFIYEVLRKDNIVVDQALGVRFNYFFTEVDYYWQVTSKNCLHRINELVQELFQKELTDKSVRELKDFSKKLKQERLEDIWECYEAYNDFYENLLWKTEHQEIRPRRIWWKAWDAFKKKIPVLKAVLTILLIFASGAFLLKSLPNPVLSEDGITFDQIGTLQIQDPTQNTDLEQIPEETSEEDLEENLEENLEEDLEETSEEDLGEDLEETSEEDSEEDLEENLEEDSEEDENSE